MKKDEYIEYLQNLAAKLGRAPKCGDTSLSTSIIRCFGSWNNALEEAGLEVNRQSRNLEKEDLVSLLKKEFDKEKCYIGRKEWDSRKLINSKTLLRKLDFNTWDELVENIVSIKNPVKRLRATGKIF